MLYRGKDLENYRILAKDGEVGRVVDFLFDDREKGIRFLVVNTGFWLFGRKVLIAPHAVREFSPVSGEILVNLTKKQIKNSPDVDAEMPVSRFHQMQLLRYYNWPIYWSEMGLWREEDKPQLYPLEEHKREAPAAETPPPFLLSPEGEELNPHLRCIKELRGYGIDARGETFGHVEDAVIDHEAHDQWTLRYLVVDTKNWWPSLPVAVSLEWVTGISWQESLIHVDIDREAIKDAPELKTSLPIDRAYEERLYLHYGKTGYWKRRAA